MESVGFKEWSLVCDALGAGSGSIIVRKGGIAEGRGGFSFRYREFFLFPTSFHQQVTKVRIRSNALSDRTDTITLRWYVRAERILEIHSLTIVEALEPLHILCPEVVRERFGYNGGGLHVAFVRVFEISPVWILQNERRYRGCRSWMELPATPEMKMRPVLSDVTHAKRRDQFDKITLSLQP